MFGDLNPPYVTIVADPPWSYPDGCVATGPGHGVLTARTPLPYSGMEDDAIRSLPVGDLAADDCRLFLWATNRYLPVAFGVLAGWGFAYRQTLVWYKVDTNLAGSVAPNSAEFLLVGTRGTPTRTGVTASGVIPTAHGLHSVKPAAFGDLIETVSPGPYVELFARAPRLGWDSWGLGFETVPAVDTAGW